MRPENRLNDIVYNAQDQRALTFVVAAGAEEGDAVTMTAHGTAGRGSTGNPLLGMLQKTEGDQRGTVVHEGVVTVRAATTIAAGLQTLNVNGAGAVIVGAGGRQCIVLNSSATHAVVILK
jgi:hypothetical protein